jgi:uncharacterized protein YggE
LEDIPMTRLLPVLILSLAAVVPASAQDATLGPATVVTLGEGIVRMAADRAVMTMSSETRGQTAAETQNLGNARMKAIQAAVDGLKLIGGQVTTTGLMLSPNWVFANNQRTQQGYVGRHTITVKFDEPGRAGEVVAAAIGGGATDMSGIRFDRRDRRTLEQEALKLAVQDARARADALAAGAGRVVDRIVRIAEEGAAVSTGLGSPATFRAGAMAESVAVTGAPIAQGDVEIRARVVLTATVK